MKLLKIIIGALIVGLLVAVTYVIFEAAVRNSIDFIWNTTFDTDSKRYLVVPITIVLSFVYFLSQHTLDRKSENAVEAGLGGTPKPTIVNLLKVLFIGYLSLIAGAALGPEAILIPACLVIGGYVGLKVSKDDKQIAKLLGAAGFVALFVAFFNSFIAALLGLFLLKQESKTKLKPVIIVISLISSLATYIALQFLESPSYFKIPPHEWSVSLKSLIILALLMIVGMLYTTVLEFISKLFLTVREKSVKTAWWQKSLFAGLGLSFLFIIGGSLIQFTGNESILPMFEQASSLGVIGLLWIVITKTFAISWSKNMGYRGGMIFPTIFVAATIVAIAQTIDSGISVPLGIIAVLIGTFIVNSKTHTLF